MRNSRLLIPENFADLDLLLEEARYFDIGRKYIFIKIFYKHELPKVRLINDMIFYVINHLIFQINNHMRFLLWVTLLSINLKFLKN